MNLNTVVADARTAADLGADAIMVHQTDILQAWAKSVLSRR